MRKQSDQCHPTTEVVSFHLYLLRTFSCFPISRYGLSSVDISLLMGLEDDVELSDPLTLLSSSPSNIHRSLQDLDETPSDERTSRLHPSHFLARKGPSRLQSHCLEILNNLCKQHSVAILTDELRLLNVRECIKAASYSLKVY